MENKIWGDGNGTGWCDTNGSRLCPVRCWVGAMLTPAVKPQWVRNKLEETIEQSCNDFLAHTLKVCKGAHWYNEYSAI
jgi:hypothetical protein